MNIEYEEAPFIKLVNFKRLSNDKLVNKLPRFSRNFVFILFFFSLISWHKTEQCYYLLTPNRKERKKTQLLPSTMEEGWKTTVKSIAHKDQ